MFKKAFTLVELLIVITILSFLAAMSTSVISSATSAANNQATKVLLQKVEAALSLFKEITKTYPYNNAYSQSGIVDWSGDGGKNNLGYHLTQSKEDMAKYNEERDSVIAGYSVMQDSLSYSAGTLEKDGKQGSFHIPADSLPSYGIVWDMWAAGALGSKSDSDKQAFTTSLQMGRLAKERALIALSAGQKNLTQHGENVLSNAQSGGMQFELLQLEDKYISEDEEDIIDIWGNSLIYISQMTFGVDEPVVLHGIKEVSTYYFPTADAERFSLHSEVRAVTDSLDSDIRTTAGEKYTRYFELYSKGEDGEFNEIRNDDKNLDNVSIIDYNEGLEEAE